jgi:hypothetical protein
VSRLAPAFQAPDLVADIQRAEALLNARATAKLDVIATQIQALQEAARQVINEAQAEHALHQARCAFKRIPGQIYYLYHDQHQQPFFSLLSPQDWQNAPPHVFVGAYRLEADYSWTPYPIAESSH